ncbi:MAG: Fpg/Nei family DNA glycosylase [Myxococcales bacterium]|nr:MAG: Fpg/Nei family DNA glycosylase [Myxococcales bacterium]
MPEGHTLHRLARDLNKDLMGKTLEVSSPQGRFVDAASLDGASLRRAFAIGKHLFLELDRALVHVHLGLFGKMKRKKLGLPPRASARLRLVSSESAWELTGPTCCECQTPTAFEALKARLGADPLGDSARPRALGERLRRSRRPIGALLLDQSFFAGIGNVYRAEILFLAKINPEAPGSALTPAHVNLLWRLAKELLKRGEEHNRIVTVKGAGGRAKRAEALYCYKRSTCRICESTIARSMTGGRAMFHCPGCQPLPASPPAEAAPLAAAPVTGIRRRRGPERRRSTASRRPPRRR